MALVSDSHSGDGDSASWVTMNSREVGTKQSCLAGDEGYKSSVSHTGWNAAPRPYYASKSALTRTALALLPQTEVNVEACAPYLPEEPGYKDEPTAGFPRRQRKLFVLRVVIVSAAAAPSTSPRHVAQLRSDRLLFHSYFGSPPHFETETPCLLPGAGAHVDCWCQRGYQLANRHALALNRNCRLVAEGRQSLPHCCC